jgi:WhiB family redox-sensing transcriptional regulator
MTKENTERIITPGTIYWKDHAACTGQAELFFNDHKQKTVKQAKEVCGECEVKNECLAHALKHQEYGVWGGLTANERRRHKRERRKNTSKENNNAELVLLSTVR